MKTRSLTRQTIGTVLVAQMLCAAILCGAALMHERHTRLRSFDTQLQGRSDSLLGAIQDAEDPEDNVTIDPAELKLPAEDIYAVYNQGGRLLGTSANAPAALIARDRDEYRDMRVNGASYRVLQREALRVIDRAEFKGGGLRRPVTIVYASPERHVQHEILEAARFYLITIALSAMLTVVFVAGLLRRLLRPLSELAEAAAHLSAPALDFKAPRSALQTRELRPLTNVLSESVGRLRESFVREHRFVGDAAHELKTAIAVVRSSVQVLMLKSRTEEEYRSGLDRVLEDTQRVEALITQMLQLARLEEVSSEGSKMSDLGKIAHEVAGLLRPIANDRGLHVNLDLSTDLHVCLSPESAEILISNLLLNAIQHSKPASPISMSVRKNESGGVCLEVEDRGVGIGSEALPHIFERFYREDTSRSRETGGTGLGLAICKSIVEAAGGRIEVESVRGVGTKMSVTFMSA